MKVRCMSNEWISKSVTVGKIYEVILIVKDCYEVIDDKGEKRLINKFRFEIVEEDKVEQVKIVRKLEDLDGLENGMGLVIKYDTEKRMIGEEKTLSILVGCNSEILCKIDVEIKESLKSILKIAKSMGFEFEYKPLRTVEEIKNEIDSLKSIRFMLGEPNWFLSYDGEKNIYTPAYAAKYCSVCEKYMEKEKAQAYADELNEIIGYGKNGL